MIAGNLDRALAELEGDSTLFEPEQMRRRIEAVDALDSLLGDGSPAEAEFRPDQAVLLARARALRRRAEDANAAVYQAIRRDIQQGTGAATLLRWIGLCGSAAEGPAPGLGYDALDELMAGVLQAREPASPPVRLEPEQVFYQPTPVRHVLQMIRLSGLQGDDVLIDLGSGLGHVCMLTSILTGVRAIGIEVEPAYGESGRECARSLGVQRVNFITQDAREADLSAGTVFYLYTPFSGSMLRTVLRQLEQENATRMIRICTLGPCTEVVAAEPWLHASAPPTADRVVLFVSRQ
jgi:hypothetical protein